MMMRSVAIWSVHDRFL